MPLVRDHHERLTWRLKFEPVPQSVGIVADEASVRHVFTTTPRELVMMTEDMQVYWRRPLPLCDRSACSDVNIAGDSVSVMAGDLVAVQIDDIQVALANLPEDVLVLLCRSHHQIEVLLEAVLVLRPDAGLHHRPAVIAYGGHDDHLVGKPGCEVDDRTKPHAGPPRGRKRRKLSQFGGVFVNDVRYEVTQSSDHDPINASKSSLVRHECRNPF